jgi:hypothetical protein
LPSPRPWLSSLSLSLYLSWEDRQEVTLPSSVGQTVSTAWADLLRHHCLGGGVSSEHIGKPSSST